MRISVALATYQGERFLGPQLASIGSQTRRPDELVVCDDGSTDATVRMVSEFARRSPFPVELQIQRQRLGPARNFERAIEHCSGELIALSDQDDVWESRKLEMLERAMGRQGDPGLVFSDGEIVDAGARSLSVTCWESIGLTPRQLRAIESGRAFRAFVTRQRQVGGTVPGATVAFRSRYRELALPFPEVIPMSGKGFLHDSWIVLLVAAVSEVVAVPKPLVRYRRHDAQQVGMRPERKPARPTPLLTAPGSIRGPSGSHHSRLWLNALYERLRARRGVFGGDEAISLLDKWLHHLDVRAHLPGNRFRRVPTIVRELSTGRYRAYSSGMRSAARDLLG